MSLVFAFTLLGLSLAAPSLASPSPGPPSPIPPVAAERTFLSDLPAEVEDALRASARISPLPEGARGLLERVLAAASSYRFEAGPVSVRTDRRWFGTLPSGEQGCPLLELRRWPGDTVLALYVLAGKLPGEGGDPPAIRGARLGAGVRSAAGSRRWEGTIDLGAGPRPAIWIERDVPSDLARLGALLLAGDAGLGATAVADLTEELLVVLDRVAVDTEQVLEEVTLPRGATLLPPPSDSPPAEGDETQNAWQIIEGKDFTLSLPPGLKAKRLDRGIPAPRPVPGGEVWLRGRFVDRAGTLVVVGDGRRAGYLAELVDPAAAWTTGEMPPLGSPGATRAAGFDFPEAREWTGAVAARAERWMEKGFDGAWLVFRLAFRDRRVEIGLPVLSGRQSPALFWIPLTWRGPDQPPAPPPIDPVERFGIRLERLTRMEQTKQPWLEGYLFVPGLRLELPRSWAPVVSLRSEDGFPVGLVDGSGQLVGQLVALGKDDAALRPAEGSEWKNYPLRPGSRAAAAYERPDGARLFVSAEGDGFLLEPLPGAKPEREAWERLVQSAVLVPGHKPSKPARPRP